MTPEHLQTPAYGPDSLAALHGVFFLCQEHQSSCRATADFHAMHPMGVYQGGRFTAPQAVLGRQARASWGSCSHLTQHHVLSQPRLVLGSYGW